MHQSSGRNFKKTEESLTRNYENYNNSENPDILSFVKNNIRDQEKKN